MSGTGNNYGLAFCETSTFDERTSDDQKIENITKNFSELLQQFLMLKWFFQPPSVPGFGSSAGFEAVLLDKSGGEYTELDKVTQQFIGKLMERPEIEFMQTSFNTKYPQYQMNINVPVAENAGVSVSDILSTMQGYIGGIYGRFYKIR